MVQRRNDALVRKAAQSSAIVTSMFPGVLREKVLDQDHTSNNKRRSTSDLTALAKGIDGDVNAMQKLDTKSKPLAELYLETTGKSWCTRAVMISEISLSLTRRCKL